MLHKLKKTNQCKKGAESFKHSIYGHKPELETGAAIELCGCGVILPAQRAPGACGKRSLMKRATLGCPLAVLSLIKNSEEGPRVQLRVLRGLLEWRRSLK